MSVSHSSLSETRGALRLGGQAFEQITRRVEEFHQAIAALPFKAIPPLPGVAEGKTAHDGITLGVYAAVRGIGGALFKGAELALKSAEGRLPASQSQRPLTPIRDDLVSAISGLVGDHLAQERNPLRPKLGFYRQGQRLPLTTAALAAAYPEASGKLAIFIHGLCCNESTWNFYVDPLNPETSPYPERLAAEQGYTPLFLRYNSGLHISLNGRTLSRQLDKLLAHWPVPVSEIALIGHSMGGLLARSAVHAAMKSRAGWTQALGNVICLGAPHQGAPLERAVHAGTRMMEAFGLSRPVAKLLNLRSVGIRNLRHGFVADEDWKGRAQDALNAKALTPIPRLENARYHFIGCSLGASEHDPIGKLIGDGLVLLPSATAAQLANADTAVLFRTHHLRLLNHPVIYRQIAERLQAPKALAAA